ncbi:MAG: hypothetical protein ACKO1L_05255, partial [Brachymonas sp.]
MYALCAGAISCGTGSGNASISVRQLAQGHLAQTPAQHHEPLRTGRKQATERKPSTQERLTFKQPSNPKAPEWLLVLWLRATGKAGELKAGSYEIVQG